MFIEKWHLDKFAAKRLITEEYWPIGVYVFFSKIVRVFTYFLVNTQSPLTAFTASTYLI
jgi:hypothetical protein